MNKSNYPRGVEPIVGIIIENGEGEILLTQSTKWGNKWVLPGGHIEPGERIIDTAVREGEEETGLKLKARGILDWGELINTKDYNRPAHFIFFIVYTTVEEGKLMLDPSELTSYQWITPKSALQLDLGDGYSAAIKKFVELNHKAN